MENVDVSATGIQKTSGILSGSISLSLGTAIGAACQFLRTMIVARIITREDFGIAATFALTAALFDMISNMNTEKLLIQARDGDNPEFQKSAQTLEVIRGTAIAVILLILAGPVAQWFSVPQAKWGFQLLALLPLLRGLRHFDLQRLQRQMQFKPYVIADTGAQIFSVIIAWPVAAHCPDYAAMLYLLLAQEVFRCIGSHLIRKRPYRWGWQTEYLQRIISFGWPLLLNGIFMFLIFQGDKFIIGSSAQLFKSGGYSVGELGLYSMAFLVTSQPVAMISRVTSSLMLPSFSASQEQRGQLLDKYQKAFHGLSILSGLMASGCILIGGLLVILLMGEHYRNAMVLIGWLGMMQSLRILRDAPTMVTIALGDTRCTAVATGIRATALIGAIIVAALQMPLVWIAICGLIGEATALASILILARIRHAIPLWFATAPVAVTIAAAGLAETLRSFIHHEQSLMINTGIYGCIAVGIILFVCRFGGISFQSIAARLFRRQNVVSPQQE